MTPRAIQSVFGAQRDAGQRLHEGIDIFAPRGTPVVAATDGWVGNALTNGLGGNVIWVWNPLAGTRTYYAHLGRHEAHPGQRVMAGEVVGYVGNTGNARGGPTHLHFGIYVVGEGSVDPLPFVCGVDCPRRR
jgi:murein DD-endopeptidase MepM/ murein hydrolase activator NlpD